MIKSNKITIKRIVFFWCIFHFVGYLSFVTGLTPGIKKVENFSDKNYILTPDYNIIPEEYEEENFYPFHKFTYDMYRYRIGGGPATFVGVFGYYGHYEFLLYIVLPLLIYLLILVYRRFVRD